MSKHNLFFLIRNNHAYAYSNLFIISKLNFPNGKKIVDTLEYEMTNKRGVFLGKGLSSNKESKLFYKENSVFPNKGEYSISIAQAMRKNGAINGIKKCTIKSKILNTKMKIAKGTAKIPVNKKYDGNLWKKYIVKGNTKI